MGEDFEEAEGAQRVVAGLPGLVELGFGQLGFHRGQRRLKIGLASGEVLVDALLHLLGFVVTLHPSEDKAETLLGGYHSFRTNRLQAVQELRLQIGGDYLAARSDAIAEPLRDRAAARPDL